MTDLGPIDRYLQQSQPSHLDLLKQWLRIASVSADTRFSSDVRRSADWVANAFKTLGFHCEIIETDGPHWSMRKAHRCPAGP